MNVLQEAQIEKIIQLIIHNDVQVRKAAAKFVKYHLFEISFPEILKETIEKKGKGNPSIHDQNIVTHKLVFIILLIL